MYVPTNAQSLQFDLKIVQTNSANNGQLKVVATIPTGPPSPTGIQAEQEVPIGTYDLTLATNGYVPISAFIPTILLGKTARLEFRLVTPQGGDVIRLDNINLVTAQPLQVASPSGEPAVKGPTAEVNVEGLFDAAQLYWMGLVNVPVGATGGGGIFSIAAKANVDQPYLATRTNAQANGGTGFGQSGFDDQGAISDSDFVHGVWFDSKQVTEAVGVNGIRGVSTHELSVNSDPTFTADGHAVEAELDPGLLLPTQHESVSQVIGHEASESKISDNGTFVGHCAIGVANVDISLQPAAPGSNGAGADLQVLDLNEIPLFLLQSGADSVQVPGLEGGHVLPVFAPGLGQSQNRQNQSALQHNLSFGTPTLPPDRSLVNHSMGNGQWAVGSGDTPFALSAEQLSLLGHATVTIADLADGYLALTTGTTITLDTDAAGYGWFIDSTPLTHEEFVSLSAWELAAAPGSGAENKIDLMTVLMHELGHVMGLGHVSSAVDGTRLMAGSIDPGVRRLPSTLDLGPEPSSVPVHSELNTQDSALPTWAPYLAHYTTTQDSALSTQHSLPAINPASLVQAAHAPSHSGIFNQNFANSDQQSATYGWEASGAVTIANGQAVLSEDSNAISTLSQTFTLPAGSTHLRFTLADVNLQTNGTNRPQDAFEVALLEASTLTPLAGVTAGLTQTDSLFNLQQNGTVRFSSKVTLSNGVTSGSTLDLTQPVIVDIDLTGITVGAGAYLSFDLLGFGDRTSTIVLDNVLLTNGQPTAAPVAVNDSYTVAEGATFNVPTLGLLTNDTDADTASTGLSALLVTGPQHGALTVHADGSFTYVHDGSETLTDAFTYRVSDGINFSNLATVSLTITPTNDAPVINPIAPQTVEQGRTLTFTAVATDPDDSNIAPESNTLTYSLGAGAPSGASIDPATGVFSWSVPRTQTVGFYQITVHVTDAGTPAFTASRTFTVEVKELTNTPPTLNPIGNKTVNEEAALRFTISATDLDIPAQTLTYSFLSGARAGTTPAPI